MDGSIGRKLDRNSLLALSKASLLVSCLLEAPPSPKLLDNAHRLLEELDDLDPNGETLSVEGRRRVREAIGRTARSEESLEADEVAYAQLFYGVGIHPVSLVESVRTGDEHLLYDNPYFEVRETYAEWGFDVDGVFEQPADDLCVQLAFTSHMLDHAVGCLDGREDGADAADILSAARAFKQDHLGSWASAACEDLKAASESELYRACGLLALEVIGTDW